jgi:LacI family transcriptional regulator
MDLEHLLEIDRASRTPLNLQLSSQLEWLISAGHLVANDRLPPVRQLAATLGINLHTVRAAYQHVEDDQLVVTQHGRGTFVLPRDPSRRGSSGSGVPASTFGVIVPAHTDLYRRMLDGIGLVAHAAPALLFVGSARESEETGLQVAQRMVGRGVDGLIVTAPLIPQGAVSDLIASFPRIVFGDWPGGPQPGVSFDLESGVSQAVHHLIDHGHSDIGLVCTPAAWVNAAPVHRSHGEALAAAGLEPGSIVTVYDYTVEAGTRALGELLDDGPAPSAVIVGNDATAIGVIRAARRRGLRIPGDLAVIGTGGHEMGEYVDPSLTTIHLPGERMGVEAMTLLLSLARGEAPVGAVAPLETSLVVRESCGCEVAVPIG